MGTVGDVATIGVPGGGSVGQWLAKNSAAAYDFGWATPPALGGGPAYLSGNWYDNRASTAVTSNNLSLAANTTTYVPVLVYAPVTINALGVTLGASVTGTLTLGVSARNMAGATMPPAALLGSAAVVNPGTSVTAVLSTPLSLNPGWIYISVGTTVACTVTTHDPGPTGGIYRQSFPPTLDTNNPQFGYLHSASAVPVESPAPLTATTAPFTVYFRVA